MSTTESLLLTYLNNNEVIEDTSSWSLDSGLSHSDVVGVVKSLTASLMTSVEQLTSIKLELLDEAQDIIARGSSPEVAVLALVPSGSEGIPLADLKAAAGPIADNGMRQAMANRWLATTKGEGGPVVKRNVETVEDVVLKHITALAESGGDRTAIPEKDLKAYMKRKIVKEVKLTSYRVSKGPEFALERKQLATDLTEEMMATGSWRETKFKDYNFNVTGREDGGHLHPLLKVRQKFREIFIQMGFTEMPTNNYVESSFWNFDALFQPQQHPARDAHDTFFLTRPAKADLTKTLDADYLTRVRNVHESGGYDSIGYGYNWSLEESEKNVLRTHTTAVSSRMLKRWADKFKAQPPGTPFQPVRYFSIDRVFRNEAIDRTHLAEFHQVEGVVCDRGLTLGHLMGTLNAFFERLGLPTLRFKPAYNPYTEPSMEIFSYHPALGKWVEVGNSGVFRPEMLRPMGLPEDVSVIAWGLSVERPTMILYGIDNIRELFGHKVSLPMIRRNPVCRIGLQEVQ